MRRIFLPPHKPTHTEYNVLEHIYIRHTKETLTDEIIAERFDITPREVRQIVFDFNFNKLKDMTPQYVIQKQDKAYTVIHPKDELSQKYCNKRITDFYATLAKMKIWCNKQEYDIPNGQISVEELLELGREMEELWLK